MAPRNHRRPFSISPGGRHGRYYGNARFRTMDLLPADQNTLVEGNIYQYKGSRKGFEAKAVKEGLYLVVDMPGVEDNDADVWMEKNELFFTGKTKEETVFEENRLYGGCIDLGSESENISDMKIDMKNGVLRIILVGCTIQPELIQNVPSSSYARPSSLSALEWCKSKDGKSLICLRRFFDLDPPDKSYGIYPFQLLGPRGCSERTIVSCDYLYMRVDMPDVPSNKKTVAFRDNEVFFGGEGEKWSEYDDNGIRGYFGKHPLSCGCCKYVTINSTIKSGVLRMLMEKEKLPGSKPCCNCSSKK